MIAWVRQTGMPILVCPEMTYEVELGKEILVDPLPADVRKHVVWRDSYWLTGEATSVYARAHSLVSFEAHSPILAATVGTPAVYLRQPTDTCKGYMWRDVERPFGLVNIEEVDAEALTAHVLALASDRAAQIVNVAHCMAVAARHQAVAMARIAELLATAPAAPPA
jgi:hypothetical protein